MDKNFSVSKGMWYAHRGAKRHANYDVKVLSLNLSLLNSITWVHYRWRLGMNSFRDLDNFRRYFRPLLPEEEAEIALHLLGGGEEGMRE